MKKLTIGIGMLFLMALVIPTSAIGNGAVIGKDFVCGIFTGDYGTVIPEISPDFGFLITENSQIVINDNNWKLTCRGRIIENFPKAAVSYTGDVGCRPLGNVLSDSDYVKVAITPSGEVTLTCSGPVV